MWASFRDDVGIVPTEYGKIVKKYITNIPGIDRYVIMPNHIHLILCNNGATPASSHKVSQKIKSLKILVTKSIGYSIFQRSFYDHIIRNQKDYIKVCEYIENNPLKWATDKYYIE